ncbi:MAG TPA: DNA repair exonuclease [Candidatus Xenobia bacterium]|jgi:DNA repair exonuclease SbcCD nuclease subunit
MSIRLLHLADLHLGATGRLTGEVGDARRQDFIKAFDAAVAFARAPDTRVDAVLICGDLFDTHTPAADLVTLVQARFEGLREDGIPVLLVPGFRDAFVYPDSVYRTNPLGAQLLLSPQRPVTLELGGTAVHFYGCAWLSRQSGVGALQRQDLPGFHVGLLHGHVGAPEPAPFHFTVSELEATALDYVALGGHRAGLELRSGNPAVVYAGSLEEAGSEGGGFLVATLEGPNQVSLARTPYAGRPVLHLTVDLTPLDLQGGSPALSSYLLRHAAPSALCRLELTGSAPFVIDVGALQALLSSHFFHLEVVDRTRFSQAQVIRGLEAEATVRGGFTRQVMAALRKGEDETALEHALKAVLKPCLEEELL